MKKKLYFSIVFILIVISILPLILKTRTRATFPQQSYCNVNFQRPIYEFKSPNGDSVFVLDENGNLYLNGTKVLFNQKSGIPQPDRGFGLMVNSNFYWAFNNTNVNIYGEILQEQTLPNSAQDNDILFRNPISKEPLAFFDGNSGDLSIKGLVIYNGYYDGMSVDENAFNSNCTTADNYNSSTGTDYWQDYYCNRLDCVYRNIDLDSSQQLCEGNHHNWNIGGNADPTTCCGDDPNEFNLTRQCNSGCTSSSTDDACCDDSNDAVNGSNCFTEGSKICSPDNSKYVIEANSGKWTFNEDCGTHCRSSCAKYATCSDGACIGDVNAPLGQNCTEDVGFVNGLCNPAYACSNATGNMIYNSGGNLSCQATCGDNGECNHATNCIDCSQQGSVNGCACACAGYGQVEGTNNPGTCDDGIDNDCDGNKNYDDYDCLRSNGESCSSSNQCLAGHCYDDTDGDGYAGTDAKICHASAIAHSGTDCYDSNPNIWQSLTGYVDNDGDGYGVEPATQICSGISLPSGYASVSGDCCDSDNRAYPTQTWLCYGTSCINSCGNVDYNCDGVENTRSCGYNCCNGCN